MPLRWFVLCWPREVTPEQVIQVCRLLVTVGSAPVVIEAVGSAGVVEHRLALPAERASSVVDQLCAVIPGLSVEEVSGRPDIAATHAVEVRLSTKRRSLRVDDLPGVSRAILTSLAHTEGDERVVLQWVLGQPLAPAAVPDRVDGVGRESWVSALLLAPFGPSRPADVEERNALRAKRSEPGWRAVGRLAVKAKSRGRERQVVRQVLGALASCEAPGVSFSLRNTNAKRVAQAASGWRAPLTLNAIELAAVSSFPIGVTDGLPVRMMGSRLVPPSDAVGRHGRVVGVSSFPGRERPLALTPTDSRRHLHVLGPTGSGKSTLLLNLITQDMQAGRAVVVIEPRGDLIADTLMRVPPTRVNDVVLLDPTDDVCPVGLNPLSLGGRSPELAADQLLGMFHSLYAAHWGPRTQDILGASLLTLARLPDMTLAALPLLLTDPGFRRRVLPKVVDPIGLSPFWSAYEAWSEQERTAAIAPVMNKLRPLLIRPELRRIVGQARPRFELRQVFTERKVLLVNLSRGELGPEASTLLGALIISQLWQAILGRSTIAPGRRHPVTIVLDEFQGYLHLPVDLADALAQARGLGILLHLAHQFLHQLDPAMRSSVLANAQSRVAFRLPAEDSRILAGSGLEPADFQNLGAFECYVQLVARDAVQSWCSARTLPPGEPTSDPAAIHAASRATYGTPRGAIDAELEALFAPPRRPTADDLSPRRRSGGGL